MSREKDIYKVTLLGSFINAMLVVLKFAAGIFGHSAAMIADAVHSLPAPVSVQACGQVPI